MPPAGFDEPPASPHSATAATSPSVFHLFYLYISIGRCLWTDPTLAMAPVRKRARKDRGGPQQDDQVAQSLLLSDYRTSWLVKYASSFLDSYTSTFRLPRPRV